MLARTEGLGDISNISSLSRSGALPGREGITLTGGLIAFADLFGLSRNTGVEFALTREVVDGTRRYRLYSGGPRIVETPRGTRVIAHAHPSGNPFPSPGDISTINNDFLRRLSADPTAAPQPWRIVWGDGPSDAAAFFPIALR